VFKRQTGGGINRDAISQDVWGFFFFGLFDSNHFLLCLTKLRSALPFCFLTVEKCEVRKKNKKVTSLLKENIFNNTLCCVYEPLVLRKLV